MTDKPPLHLPPPVMKVVLGMELARIRNLKFFTQDEAAERLGCTQQKIAHIEAGCGIRRLELDALLDLYEIDETERLYVRTLQAAGQRRSKRGAFSSRFDQHMRLLVDMEPSCQRYFSYQALVVPGLLQTEQYMRRNAGARRPSFTLTEIDQLTDNRLGRQRVLDNTDQQFWFVIDEAALRRTEGGPLMKAQINQLIAAIDRPNVVLQIVPLNIGYYMGQGHVFTIFSFDIKPAADIIYLERHEHGEYVDNDKRTPPYLTLRDHHKAVANGPEQSRRLLVDIAKSL